MAVKDALAPKRTRLVGEERPECRDDRSKSSIDEFLNHVLDVFVCRGSLFIEQVPLSADDPATQRRLGQLMHAEALAHTLAGFAPGPFTTRAVSQRPGTACAITQRLDQVAERAARTRDDHRFAFGCHSSLAVHPNGFTFVLPRGDAVVATVPEQVSLGTELLHEARSEKPSVHLGPAHGQVMALQVSRGGEGLRVRPSGLMLIHIIAQDGFTQTARAAVDQHNQLLLAQAEALECPRIKHLIDHLQLRKVVTATKRSQGLVEFSGFKFRRSENFLHLALSRIFQVKAQTGPLVELDVTLDEVSLEQSHTAADVAADEVRVDEPLGYKGRTNRAAFARMQVRKTDCQAHPIEYRRSVELAKRLAFDPAVARGEEAHIASCQCVHVCFLPVKAGLGFLWGGWFRNSSFRTPEVTGPRGWYRANVSSSSGRR